MKRVTPRLIESCALCKCCLLCVVCAVCVLWCAVCICSLRLLLRRCDESSAIEFFQFQLATTPHLRRFEHSGPLGFNHRRRERMERIERRGGNSRGRSSTSIDERSGGCCRRLLLLLLLPLLLLLLLCVSLPLLRLLRQLREQVWPPHRRSGQTNSENHNNNATQHSHNIRLERRTHATCVVNARYVCHSHLLFATSAEDPPSVDSLNSLMNAELPVNRSVPRAC